MLRRLDDIWGLPDPVYTLEPVIPDRSIIVVYGQPGLGKSTFVLQLLMHVATGTPWNGQPVTASAVVNVWVEGHLGDIKKRHDAAVKQLYGQAPDTYLWEDTAVDLANERDVDNFIERVDKLSVEPKVVSFDSFSQCIPGADENSAQDMSLIFRNLDSIRSAWDSSIILVHHPDKEGKAARGSSVLKANIDVEVRVSGSDRSPRVTLTSGKVRGGPPFKFQLRREVVKTNWGSSVIITLPNLGEPTAGEGSQSPSLSTHVHSKMGAPTSENYEKAQAFISAHKSFMAKELQEFSQLSTAQTYRVLGEAKAKGLITKKLGGYSHK